MVRESDVANAGPESNLVVLPGPSGARWACRIPDVTEEVEEETVERRDPEVERREAEGKLEPMKSGCLYYLQGWFTYEYCHLQHVRQFHKRSGPEDTSQESQYMLGRFTPAESSLEVRAGLDGKKYARVRFDGGTVCDLTGQPRAIEIQFHCPLASAPHLDHISIIQETSTCNYLLVVQTPKLCGGAFSPAKHGKVNAIPCESVVSDGYYELANQDHGKGKLAEVAAHVDVEPEQGMTAAQAEKAEMEAEELEKNPEAHNHGAPSESLADGEIKITFDLDGAADESEAAKKLLAGMMTNVAAELKKKLKDAQAKAEEGRKERKKTLEEMRRAQEGVGDGKVIVDAQGRAKVVDEPDHDHGKAKATKEGEPKIMFAAAVEGEGQVELTPEVAAKIRDSLAKLLDADGKELHGVKAAEHEHEAEAATDWMKDAERELREEDGKKVEYAVAEDEEGGEDGVVLEM